MTNNKESVRIDFAHKEVHDGDTYQVFFADETLADDETINFAFKTPALITAEIHMFIEFGSLVGAQLAVIEAPTWTASSGTIKVPINVNRNSTNTSSILGNETTTAFAANEVAYNVTTILTTNATTIDEDVMYTAKKSGGITRGSRELILKADTQYVVVLTAEGASNMGYLKLRWYEYLPSVI